MFNQTRLELKPSPRLAIILSIPCFASLALVICSKLPVFVTALIICIYCLVIYRLITRYCLLKSEKSISLIEIRSNKIYLQNKKGLRYQAKPLKNNIIYPCFTLLSFECIALPSERKAYILDRPTNSERQTNRQTVLFKRYIEALYLNSIFFNRLKSALSPKLPWHNDRQTILLSRYNVMSLRDFRRIRVWLKFQD